jgi:hypothetical protein
MAKVNTRTLKDIENNDFSHDGDIDNEKNEEAFEKHIEGPSHEENAEAHEKHLNDQELTRQNVNIPLVKGEYPDSFEVNYQGILNNFFGEKIKLKWKNLGGSTKKRSFECFEGVNKFFDKNIKKLISSVKVELNNTFENADGVPISYAVLKITKKYIEDFSVEFNLKPSFDWSSKENVYLFWVIYDCDNHELSHIEYSMRLKYLWRRFDRDLSSFRYSLFSELTAA